MYNPFEFVATNGPGDGQSADIDWQAVRRDILAGLDVAAEYRALGVEFASPAANSKGWRDCRAIDRPDDNPSAAVHVESGVYHDQGGAGKAVGFFDFALEHGGHGSFIATFRHYAAKAGVTLGNVQHGSKGAVLEATYPYKDEAGEVLYQVRRHIEPNGKKRIRPYAPDGRGGWETKTGCMDGIRRVPYRLPELLAADPEKTVFVVEGEKDTDRLHSLDVIATTSGGKASTSQWVEHARLLVDRRVVILPDRDIDKRTATRDLSSLKHAHEVARHLLHGGARSVKVLDLPGLPAKGDVGKWLDLGHEAAELHKLAYDCPEWTVGQMERDLSPAPPRPEPTETIPTAVEGPAPEAASDPHKLARLHIARRFGHPERTTFLRWKSEWHGWTGSHWNKRPDEEVKDMLVRDIKEEFDRIARMLDKPFKGVDTKVVGGAYQAFRSTLQLRSDECPGQPAWIGGRLPGDPPAMDLLVASNALVNLPEAAAGRPAMLTPTPRYFNAHSLDYPFEPDAPHPPVLLDFLAELWDGDQESIDFLQEWFGYMLTPDTSLQKLLFIHGVPRSGKSTLGRLIKGVFGAANVSTPNLTAIGTDAGFWAMIQKPVAILGESEMGGKADRAIIVERIKGVTGEDGVQVSRKYLPSWEGQAPTRITIMGNKLPSLSDKSNALAKRILFLKLTRTFEGHEDEELTYKLLAERPGILNWAIEGWARLNARTPKRLYQPRAAADLMDDFVNLSNSLDSFLKDFCEVGPDLQVEIQRIYQAWKKYVADRGIQDHSSEAMFGRDLRSAVAGVTTETARMGGPPVKVYRGISLRIDYDAVPF